MDGRYSVKKRERNKKVGTINRQEKKRHGAHMKRHEAHMGKRNVAAPAALAAPAAVVVGEAGAAAPMEQMNAGELVVQAEQAYGENVNHIDDIGLGAVVGDNGALMAHPVGMGGGNKKKRRKSKKRKSKRRKSKKKMRRTKKYKR